MKGKLFLFIILVAAIAAGVWIWTATRTGESNLNVTTNTTTNTTTNIAVNGNVNAVAPIVVLLVQPNRGPAAGGTEVTVSGEGFVEGVKLSFGEAAATDVVRVDGTTLKSKTPAHAAGAVDVTAVNPDRKTAKATAGFTYE